MASVELEDFVVGETTTYVPKMNRNNAQLNTVLNAILLALGGGRITPNLMRVLFGTTQAVVINEGACLASIAGVGVGVNVMPGYAYLPALDALVVNAASPGFVNMAALDDGTYYITLDVLGVPGIYHDDDTDALYEAVKTGGVIVTLTKVAKNASGLSLIPGGLGFQCEYQRRLEHLANGWQVVATITPPVNTTIQYSARYAANLHYGAGEDVTADAGASWWRVATFRTDEAGVVTEVGINADLMTPQTEDISSAWSVLAGTDGTVITFQFFVDAPVGDGQILDVKLLLAAEIIRSTWAAPL